MKNWRSRFACKDPFTNTYKQKKPLSVTERLFCGAYGTRNRRSRFACKEP